MQIHTHNENFLKVKGRNLEGVEKFTYLSSVMIHTGGEEYTFRVEFKKNKCCLYNIWRSRTI